MRSNRGASTPKVLGVILAGGKGERLFPLTRERSKPAVPFGGKYRIIDFVLSNFVNSNIGSIYVLVQYRSQSLIEHLRTSWPTGGLVRDQFITVVPPQMRLGSVWYRGTADAVRQNVNLIRDFDPDIVAVFGADHIYRMDIGQMLRFHTERKADVSVATLPVGLKDATSFGVVQTDSNLRISGFEEKPSAPRSMPGDSSRALCSMGNYLFNTETLIEILEDASLEQPDLDFGRSLLPILYRKKRAYAYDFATNILPGQKPYEEKAYWRDVGTLTAYYKANMDILGAQPRLNLNNKRWFTHSSLYDGPPAKIINGRLSNCIIGDGCFIKNATIRNSIIGRGVHILDRAIVEDSIVMDSCKIRSRARIRRVIVDRYNEIAARETIGFDAKRDAERYFLDASGIVAVPRGRVSPT